MFLEMRTTTQQDIGYSKQDVSEDMLPASEKCFPFTKSITLMLRTSSLDKRKYLRQALEKAMKPVNDHCKESNLCPFMIAVSYKENPCLQLIICFDAIFLGFSTA